ncbi:hypothetical protein ACH0B5_06395, partial [Ureibacillus sp. 179-F W5.1 NHS]|uniref:hypothetical protein n=1 Tax=Ureibacillus sp. 179-F W5.1 NHS TaxID=3374297 RepID=UPI00387A2F3F
AGKQSFGNPSIGTNPQKVREEIAQEAGPFAFGKTGQAGQAGKQSFGNPSIGTNPQKVREEIAQEAGPFAQSGPSANQTVTGTDINEVKRQNQQAEQGKNKF